MLSDALRTLRNQRDLTQREVADALSIDRTTYTCYELARTKPDFITLCRIARLFGVTLNDIEVLSKSGEKNDEEADLVSDSTDGFSEVYTKKMRDFYSLSKDERELLLAYRASDKQSEILDAVKKISRESDIFSESTE